MIWLKEPSLPPQRISQRWRNSSFQLDSATCPKLMNVPVLSILLCLTHESARHEGARTGSGYATFFLHMLPPLDLIQELMPRRPRIFVSRGRKYTPPPWKFSFFSGSEASCCMPFFPDLWCIPCSPFFTGKQGKTP